MTRMNIALIATAVALSGILAVAATLPANPQSQVAPRFNGRYQVVNGTPEIRRDIMLLDTETGQTWIICETETGINWCQMSKGHEQTGKEASSSPQ